ncbi:MAG: LysM peptidoglycan-binding domain-containing protein [Clostridia bacterium]|nr:LysM peptidoglycan-binding domain-containing protein [Clostridia bacterium]
MRKRIFKIFVSVLIILTAPMYILITPVYAFSPWGDVIYQGIDVSGWQGNINYAEVKNSGIEIVYMKSSEGRSFIDPYFNQNYTNAKANGLKVGFYHYLIARSNEEAIEEARFFVSVISGKEPDCRLAMDFESFGNLSVEEINQIGITFMTAVQNLSGKEVIIYSNTNDARNIFSGELTNYPLWVAQYEVYEPTPNGKWSTWAGWQYTSTGEVAGISGHVDRNKFTNQVLLNTSGTIPLPDNTDKPIAGGTTTITIQRGDTLSRIALEYNTTVARLVELNNIANPNLIYTGQKLIVPSGETPDDTDGNSTSGQTIYIVKAGDTLNQIAASFGTTARAIAVENNIRNINLIYVGQRLIIPTNRYDLNHTLYKIRWGDTLYSISRRYGVPIATIVRLNRIQNPNLIYAGQTIRI